MAKQRTPDDTPRPSRRGRGRPATGRRLDYRYVVAASPEYQAWVAYAMQATGKAEAADLWRDAMRALAQKHGLRMPPAI